MEDLMKKLALLFAAVVLAVMGVALARYAEADDAPGGVVMGWVLVGVGVVVGLKALIAGNSTHRVG